MAAMIREQNGNRGIEAALEARRASSRRALETRRRLVYDKIPEIEEIEFEIAEIGIRFNRALLAGGLPLAEAQSGLDGEIDALRQKSAGLLRLHGFEEDCLTLAPECRICGDTGFAAGPDGAPERCECYKKLLFSGMESASNLTSAGAAGFDLFDESLFSDKAETKGNKRAASPRQNIIKIRDSARRFVKAFNNGVYENLYLFGQTGTGKTFMAASIANEIMRGGTAVLYLSAPALFNLITEHQMRRLRDETYRDTRYRQIYSCRLLIIDDLGVELTTDARYSEFVSLLNERLAPKRFSTIVSTNMDLGELRSRYDERIVSRIIGSFRIIRFYGEDLREKTAP